MDYGLFSDLRNECVKKFGGMLDLPIIDNPYLEAKSSYTSGDLLDVGAGKDLPLKQHFISTLKNGNYFAMDNDPRGHFDFKSTKEIKSDLKFNLAFANQVLEHLEIPEAENLIQDLFNVLNPEAVLILTVPNINHPVRHWGDVTHKTAWNYNAIYPLLEMNGFSVIKIARYSKKHPQGLIEKFIAQKMASIYRIDWCDSILVKATKQDRKN